MALLGHTALPRLNDSPISATPFSAAGNLTMGIDHLTTKMSLSLGGNRQVDSRVVWLWS